MTSAIPAASGTAAAIDSAAMARLGIARVPADHFEVGGYRYTNLGDAVAEARRRQSAANGT